MSLAEHWELAERLIEELRSSAYERGIRQTPHDGEVSESGYSRNQWEKDAVIALRWCEPIAMKNLLHERGVDCQIAPEAHKAPSKRFEWAKATVCPQKIETL